MKTCNRCSKTYNINYFFSNRTRKDGLSVYCKKCHSETVGINTSQALRKRLISLLGDKCKMCGFDDIRALQIDHINGGGRKDSIGTNNPRKYYENMFNALNTVQILCANCNWIKRYTHNELITKPPIAPESITLPGAKVGTVPGSKRGPYNITKIYPKRPYKARKQKELVRTLNE